MTLRIAFAALLLTACVAERRPAPEAPEAPAALPPAPPPPESDPTIALTRELARLEDLAGRTERLEGHIARMAPRVEHLRRASDLSTSRPDVLRALHLAIADGPRGLRVVEVHCRGNRWTVSGLANAPDLVPELARLVAQSLRIREPQGQPQQEGSKWAYSLSFLFPDRVEPGGPAAASPPAAMTTPEERRLQLAIAELQSRTSLSRYREAQERSDALMRDLDALERLHLIPGGGKPSDLESNAFAAQARLSGLDRVHIGDAGASLHEGLAAQHYLLQGAGSLGEAADVARTIGGGGAFIGDVIAQRPRMAADFELTIGVIVAIR